MRNCRLPLLTLAIALVATVAWAVPCDMQCWGPMTGCQVVSPGGYIGCSAHGISCLEYPCECTGPSCECPYPDNPDICDPGYGFRNASTADACDSETVVDRILAEIPESATTEEVLRVLEERAASDPELRKVLDGMRILGPEGEIYRGPDYSRGKPAASESKQGPPPARAD